MASKRTPATEWNREDRDLLIELRTEQANMRDDLAGIRAEIKDINTGISARVLNLEGNAVSRIEISDFEKRIRTLEDFSNQWIGKQSVISAGIGAAIALIASFITVGKI